MGCTSCGTSVNGKPSGCKSNGGCSSGGCNRLNVYDWLANLPFSDPESSCRIVEVSFNQGSRKEYFRNVTLQPFIKGELVTVEGISGFDVGEISLTGELVRLQLKKKGIKEDAEDIRKILRKPSETDLQKWEESKSRQPEAVVRARAIARQLGLNMKLTEVDIQADGRKATFFYTADDRVDFRELIKIYAGEFKVKVEMRQIGARQEAAKVGGIGSCGRELCCSTWLNDFKSVNTTAARYQNLSINQTKLSGQCGRLKCCLNYELDTYLDALQHFPDNAEVLKISRGNALLVKKDIFKNLLWYTLPDSTKHYPVSIERAKEIIALNKQGVYPEELQTVEIVSGKAKDVEPEFVDVVGQISLRSLERADKKRKQQKRNDQPDRNRPQASAGNRPAPPPARRDQRPAKPEQGTDKPLHEPQLRTSPNPRPQQQGPREAARPNNPEARPNRPNPGPRQGGNRPNRPNRPPNPASQVPRKGNPNNDNNNNPNG